MWRNKDWWTTTKIADALGLRLSAHDAHIPAFSIDTRTLQKGDCFIVLDGGEAYIADAYAKGASCTIGPVGTDFVVGDSVKALEALSRYACIHSTAKRVAITGSMGKTTTKDFAAQILSQVYPDVVAAYESYNNHLGVPLTLTRLKPITSIGLFEIGSNHSGEIEPLSALVAPDIAMITAIGKAHIGNFGGTQEGVVKEKAMIFSHLKPDGVAILPYEWRHLAKNPITFGVEEGADVQLIKIEQGTKVTTLIDGQCFTYHVPFFHRHHVMNTLPVLCLLKALGIQLRPEYFANLVIPEGRGNIYDLALDAHRTVTVINDAFNGTFDGFKAAFHNLAAMPWHGRKLIVLGDMVDLGDDADRYHQELAAIAEQLELHTVYTCGSCFAKAFKQTLIPVTHVQAILHHELEDRDVILFKGSKMSKVHTAVLR